MGKPENDQKPLISSNANLAAAGLAGQIGCVVPVIILASVLGGLWLDRTFNTDKLFTLILVLGSLPLSIYLTFRLALRAVKEINQTLKPPAPRTIIESDEEKTSE